MNPALSVVFYEDDFVCASLPNEGAWEVLRVNGADRSPLYFYVTREDVRNDAFAKERFQASDVASFGKFYSTILDPTRTFRQFDSERQPIELLNDVVQQIKEAYFERMKAFSDESDSLSRIPLNLCFVPGIHPDARAKISDYFVSQGCSLNFSADYLDSLVTGLQQKGIVSQRVNLAIVESSFGDLYLHYLECNGRIVKRKSKHLVGKGVSHRVSNLARLFVEKAAQRAASRILGDRTLLEQEIKAFHDLAAREIQNFRHDQLDLTIKLSDYSEERVIVDRLELERMSATPFKLLKHEFEQFINEHSNLALTEKILLNGDALAAAEFVQFFEHEFGASKIIRPLNNVVEILSRGVFSCAPESAGSAPKRLEITIRVKTEAADGFDDAEPVRAPPRPPMVNRPAAPPPRPELPKPAMSVRSPESDRKVGVAPLPAKPPLPPAPKAPPATASPGAKPAKTVLATPPGPPKGPPPVPPMPPAKGKK